MKAVLGVVAALTLVVTSALAGADRASAAARTPAATAEALPAAALSANTAVGPLAREAANSRVWFHPGENQTIPTDIWSFDNGSATGFKRSNLTTTTAWPAQTQSPFTYRAGGTTVELSWTVTGTYGRIVTLGYTAATDVMLVTVDGHRQLWYGCKSTGIPDAYRPSCD
jgi:type II secretory pathway pseudopilin PulG